MFIVAAGNWQEFYVYCKKHGLDPRARHPQQALYATVHSLRGLRLQEEDQIVYYGTFGQKPLAERKRIGADIAALKKDREMRAEA